MLYSKLRRSFLLKPEITQKVKLVHSLNAHQDVLAGKSSTTIPEHHSGLAKIASLFGNHRHRASAVMLGLAVSMGITSFPSNYLDTVAVATASATTSSVAKVSATATSNNNPDRYVDQIRNDVSAMRAEYDGRSHSDLIAQSVSSPRAYPLSVANRTDSNNNVQFGGEAAVQIEVAAPKTKTFKPVATASPYYNNPGNAGSEGGLDDGGDRFPRSTTGETNLGFQWPAAGKLTSRFGRRWGRMHKGIDIAGPIGTPIIAAADGTVTVAGWSSGYGKLIELRHSDGTITRYGHNSQLSVGVGQVVRQGQQVAEMGSTGHSTGSHVHFEIHPTGGSAVNPIAYLPANS
jgi:murein DD-endopeptidase MepM/ murein hydrolase activator NlpD